MFYDMDTRMRSYKDWTKNMMVSTVVTSSKGPRAWRTMTEAEMRKTKAMV
jgi:hypothetical protein